MGREYNSPPMDGIKQWMLDNKIFSGLAGVILIMVGGVIAYFYKRRNSREVLPASTVQQGQVGTGNVVNVQGSVGNLAVGAAGPVNPSAEQVRVDVKEATPQRRLPMVCGGFDVDRGVNVRHEAWLPYPAELKIRCHNLTGTPVVVDQIRLLNADSNQEIRCFDGDSKRIDAFGSVEINLKFSLDNEQSYETPPQWRGLINITTVRGGAFLSKPFQWTNSNRE